MSGISTKITPNLWFNNEAKEAIGFYCSIFPDAELLSMLTLRETPSGDTEVFTFKLWGTSFSAINGGPIFSINQSISFFVYCGGDKEIERIHAALMADGGSELIPLDTYPWSRKYAWIKDRFGVSWQLDVDEIRSEQKIVPALLFTNAKMTWVKEAISYYAELFEDGRVLMEAPFDSSLGFPEGTLVFAQAKLDGYILNCMSGPGDHQFDFNEGVSLMVDCKDQQEVDYFWSKLSDGGEIQPCGWVKDKFGVSWQVVPSEFRTMLQAASVVQQERLLSAMLEMEKLDIEILRNAYLGGK